jgi:hypothetical protein
MWRSLKNFWLSLWTYSELSPDLRLRRRVKRRLNDRPLLNRGEWYERYWQGLGVSRQVSDFVYTRFQDYSGLDWGRIQPSDRLVDDLRFPLVCWFDWQTALQEDFLAQFDVELDPMIDPNTFATVEALMMFLNHRLLSINHS